MKECVWEQPYRFSLQTPWTARAELDPNQETGTLNHLP